MSRCNYACAKGQPCPARPCATATRTRDGGEQVDTSLPAVMFTAPYAWLDETIQRAKELFIALAVIALVAGAVGLIVGLQR
jgi:hypothetical protein